MAVLVAYGNTTFSTAQGKIVTLMNTLKTALAAGSGGDTYSPLFSYVYSNHTVANIQLNAVSVALDSCVTDTIARGGGRESILYLMQFSIRVHTDYEDGQNNVTTNMNLLNSIANKLLDNQKFGANDGYRIIEVDQFTTNVDFEESATIGGQMIVNMEFTANHVQE